MAGGDLPSDLRKQTMNKKKLQRLIDRTVKTSNAFQEAQSELNEYCIELYGSDPSDLDADILLDAVYGGCGLSRGFSADDFDQEMRALTE